MRKLLAVVAFSTLALASTARAEVTPRAQVPVGGMDNQISVWLIDSYYYSFGGIGLGARYQKTIVPQGFLQNAGVRDDFGLEGGIDYVHYSWSYPFGSLTYNEISFVVGGVWNFWLTRELVVYPKIDLGLAFGSWSSPQLGSSHPSSGGLVLQGAAGIAYKLNQVALRAEVGSGYLRGGVGFNF
jgi:hypothetical protein